MIERLLAADGALERGELEIADRLFTQVAGADPRNAIAVVGLARVALRREERDEARELALRALDIDPQEAAAQRLLTDLDAVIQPDAVTQPDAVAQPVETATPRWSWWRRLIDRILGRG